MRQGQSAERKVCRSVRCCDVRPIDALSCRCRADKPCPPTLDLETVLATIVAKAVQLSNTDAGVIYVFDELDQTLRVRATQSFFGIPQGPVLSFSKVLHTEPTAWTS